MGHNPLDNIKTDDLERVIKQEEQAAKAQGLTNPSEALQELDLGPVPAAKHKEPWMRRDYTKYLEAWDQIAVAERPVAIAYTSESQARNARSEFYKARAKHKATMGHAYPESIESLATFTISLKRARAKSTARLMWVLVFERQAPPPTQVQSIEELSEVLDFEKD